MEFMLGCNYWDSEHGTDMWLCFDADVIEKDVKALSENGVKYMRVFPNWRDFQPINRLQADSSLPSFTFFGSVRFALSDIFFKFKLPILVGHICTSFRHHNSSVLNVV